MGVRDADEGPRRILDLDGHDAYTLLGLSPAAATEEISPAYRRAMLVAHPDRGGTARWAQLVNCAFDVLSRHRQDYDDYLMLHPPGRRNRQGRWDDGQRPFGPGEPGSTDGQAGAPGVTQVDPDGVLHFLRAETEPGPVDEPLDDDPDDGYRVGGGPADPHRTGPIRTGPISSAPSRTWWRGRSREPVLPLLALGGLLLVVAVVWFARPGRTVDVTGASPPRTTSWLSASPVPTLPPPAPSPVTPGRGATAATGAAAPPPALHHCDVHADGSLWCAGANQNGQLGDGSTVDRAQPVRVSQPADQWVSVVVDQLATCALRADGGLWCWGDDSHGQLGDGGTTARAVPGQVAPGSAWLAVALDTHTCAVRDDHTLWCWGSDQQGQLGDGGRIDRRFPQRVGSEESWAAVTVSHSSSCGIRRNGTRQCWGQI
jgi:DnaJ domain/Regulator of chromosome condensation (RCC1) repeat